MKNKLFSYSKQLLKYDIVFAICAISALLIDQISKHLVITFVDVGQQVALIPRFLYITHIKNSGAAFGFFQDKTNILIVITFIAIIFVLILKLTFKFNSYLFNLSLGFILGGAVGNLIDRYFLGQVTDFIYFSFFPAVFNGADSFLVVNFIILIILILKNFLKKDPEENKN